MSTLETAVRWLAVALAPVGGIVSDDESKVFFAQLGWTVPSVPDAWHGVVDAASNLLGSLATLIDTRAQVAAGETSDSSQQEAALAADAVLLAGSLATLGDGFRTQLPSDFVAATHIDTQVLDRLYVTLVEQFLRQYFGFAHAMLVALGVIETTDEPANDAAYQPAYTAVALHWERLGTALTNPGQLLHDVYGWGTDAIDSDRLFSALLALSYYFGVPAEIHYPDPATVTALDPAHTAFVVDDLAAEIWVPVVYDGTNGLFVVLTPLPTTAGTPQRLALTLALKGELEDSIPLTSKVTLVLDGSVQIGSNAAVVFGPGESPRVVIDGAPDVTEGRIGAGVQFAALPGPTQLLALSATSGLDVQQIAVSIAATRTSGSPPDATIELDLSKLHLHITPGDSGGDGLLAAILPSGGLDSTVDGTLVWSTSTGVHISGGAGLTLSVPASRSLGPLTLTGFGLTISAAAAGISLAAHIAATATLGPITLGIDGIGMAATLGFTAGNLGPLDLDVGFLPPRSISLGINASPISGGGALLVDSANSRYAGELTLGFFDVKLIAYGLIETKPPGGGYSIVAAISAQFQPIELGLGFTLNGVGGLVGINRHVDTDALRAALRATGIDDLFFPSNPVAQAARLLTDLSTYFPATAGRYVFGPAVKIGWGTPTLVTGELAVLIEVPDPIRIVLLGSVTTSLPTKDHALVVLNVEVVGELDFTAKTLAIDASLVNSKVVGFPLIGDFALRLAWGDPPSFVVSVGGFHSQFTPPPGFPTLKRVTIPIGSGSNPRLDIQGFLALTSNTAQVGAQIDLYAAAGPLSLVGTVGFEALFQFSPFSFEVDLSAGVALKRGSTTLAGVQLDGTLSGPSPWQIAGEACLSLWFVDLCVPFSATFGSAQDVEAPPTQIWPLLQAALQAPGNWSAQLPDGAARVATTAPPVDDTSGALRVDPMGSLVVRQTVCPLDRPITKFGQGTPSGPNEFTMTSATIGAAAAAYSEVDDYFAPAQFEDMSDADKLSRAGFERMASGASLATAAVAASAELTAPMSYDTTLIVNGVVQTSPTYRPTMTAQLLGCARSANASAPLRTASLGGKFAAPALLARGGLADDTFAIASATTLTARTDLAAAAPRGAIELTLAAHLAANPNDAGTLIVVPTHELAA